MLLLHMTDRGRSATLRLLCVDLDLDYASASVEDVFDKLYDLKEKAEKYDSLCK